MKEQIIASIMEALTRCTDYQGVNFLDKFDTDSLTDFAETIYGALPMYPEENVEIINTRVLLYLNQEQRIQYIEDNIRTLLALFVKKDRSKHLLTTLAFMFNNLNITINEVDLEKYEEEHRRFMLSHLLANVEAVVKQVNKDDIQGTTLNVGNEYIRITQNNQLIPTEKTKKKYSEFLNLKSN